MWDVELDVSYSFNSRAGKNSVLFGDDVFLEWDALDEQGEPFEVEPLEVQKEALEQFDIDRHLKDSLAVRLGGSYAFFPRIAAINGGIFFETRGVDPDYASIDTFAFQRIGFGVGFVTHLGAFEFSSAFGHIFQEDLLVAPPGHQARQQADPDDPASGFDQRVAGTVMEDPDAPSTSEADGTARLQQPAIAASEMIGYRRVVNAGKYTASFNVLSLGLSYRF